MSRHFLFVLFFFLAILFWGSQLLAQPPELQVILDDFDISQAELMQLGTNIGSRMNELSEKFEARFKEPPTLDNYRERVGLMLDEIGPSVTTLLREELQNFLTPAQYQKMETRVLQAHTAMLNEIETTENPEVMMGTLPVGMMQMAIGPASFLEFTDEQKEKLLQLQRKTILDSVGAGLELEKQFKNTSPTDMDAQMRAALIKFRPIALHFKKEYEKILTDKQRAKIEEVMNDLPDYLWKMLPQNKGKEREWRPGPNSWKPGDGVPEGAGTERETKPDRSARRGIFPGN